jgi:hypothetical protein
LPRPATIAWRTGGSLAGRRSTRQDARKPRQLQRLANAAPSVRRVQRRAAEGNRMKKTTTIKRLNINRETLRSLELAQVTGGGLITAPSKPQASCFIVCVFTNDCRPTEKCVLLSADC